MHALTCTYARTRTHAHACTHTRRAQDEVSKAVLASLKTGQQFVLLLSNGVPPLDKYWDPEKVPPEILDPAALKAAMASDDVDSTPFKAVVDRGGVDHKGASWGTILRVHDALRPVVVTKLPLEGELAYDTLLKDALPWGKMQPIKVFRES